MTENYGITKEQRSIKVYLEPSSENRFLVVENPHINKLIFKRPSTNDLIKTGDHYPYTQRKINNRFFVFALKPFLKKDTVNLIFDKSGENLSYTLRILNEKEFKLYERNDNLIIGLIVGFYSLAFLIAVLLFFYFRSIKIFLFLSYIFFSFLWILNDAGVLYEYLWPNAPVWHNSTRGFLSSLTIILFALYIRENKNKIFNRNVIRVVIVIIGALAFKFSTTFLLANGIFPEKLKYSSSHLNGYILFSLFTTVSLFILLEIKKHRNDLFEMFAILTYCFFVISLSLRELGYSFFIFNSIHQLQALPFFLLQLIFMSIHIFNIEAEYKREREIEFIQYKINQQRETDKQILQVEENEKKRIAQNIHDEIGGIFVSIKYQVLSLKEKVNQIISQKDLDRLIELSNIGVQKQYSIIDDLLFEIDDKKTFINHLRDHLDLIIVKKDIVINSHFDADESHWTFFQKTQLFRIIAELITNTIKHANASVIEICITNNQNINMKYFDNGIGYNINTINKRNGIKNILTRVNAMNGKITFNNDQNITVIDIEIPIKDE